MSAGKQAPVAAPFGRRMLAEWALDPEITYLNHGTVGAPPRRALAAQQAIRDEIELQPSRFMLREISHQLGAPLSGPSRLRAAAIEVAKFVGARGEDLVFVDNATTGANAVLRSFDLREGDEILVTDLLYGAIEKTASYVARRRGATVRRIELPAHGQDAPGTVRAIESAIGPRTRLLVVDHISAETALIMPLAEIAARCRARGVAVLADGAHAPGAIALDVPSLGVDWYTANLHKWAWAPRSSGFLWASPGRQIELHPAVISWGLDKGFAEEFDWVGTRDPSPWLAAPAGIAFMEELGIEAVRDWNHMLAREAARLLSARWKTRFDVPPAMTGTMVTVPLPESFGSTHDDATRLRSALLFEDRIEVQLHAAWGRLHVRVSAQIYNDLDDVDRLASAVAARQ